MIQGMYAVASRRKPVPLAVQILQWGPIMLIASTYLMILLGNRPFETSNRWRDLKESASIAARAPRHR